MGLGLQRDDGLDLLFLEEAGLGGRSGVEEPELGTLDEGAVVLVCGDDAAGIDRRGLLYQLEEGAFHLHSVDDEGAVEYLVAAVFRIDLGESEYLAVGQRSAELGGEVLEILDLVLGESQALFLVICFEISDVANGLGLTVDDEDVTVQSVVYPLEHLVVGNLGVGGVAAFGHGEELLDSGDAGNVHVLSDFHCCGAPGRNHLAPGTDECAGDCGVLKELRTGEKPCKGVRCFSRKCCLRVDCYDLPLGGAEKVYHDIL